MTHTIITADGRIVRENTQGQRLVVGRHVAIDWTSLALAIMMLGPLMKPPKLN